MTNRQLNIIEIFPSVQGETSLMGLPTLFVRLAACNLRCSWCDTTYSFGRGVPFNFDTILSDIQKADLPYVCITGGEPLLQENVYPLMTHLCDLGYLLSLETGGSLSTQYVDPRVRVILDIKCPGSGMHTKNHWANLDYLKEGDEVKFVLNDNQDYEFAKSIVLEKLNNKPAHILLSPVHGILDPKELVKWILADKLKVRLNLQIHKFIWAPETRGV
jgi:7-carboxy-7-deazaguanine synthase